MYRGASYTTDRQTDIQTHHRSFPDDIRKGISNVWLFSHHQPPHPPRFKVVITDLLNNFVFNKFSVFVENNIVRYKNLNWRSGQICNIFLEQTMLILLHFFKCEILSVLGTQKKAERNISVYVEM